MPTTLRGLSYAGGAVLGYGTFPIFTRLADWGDGMMAQLVMCAGIYTVSFFVHLTQCLTSSSGCPAFVPMAAVGGAVWALSNCLLAPLVEVCGIGLSMLLWGLFEMLTGWATARFGLLGLAVEPVASDALDFSGISLAAASLAVLCLVTPNTLASGGTGAVQGDAAPLLPAVPRKDSPPRAAVWTDALSPRARRVFAIVACGAAGMLSGSTFSPLQLVVDRTAAWVSGGQLGPAPYPGASTQLLDMLFSHASGIMVTSIALTAVYAAALRGQPRVPPRALLPAFAAGLIWGLACLCWFNANAELAIVVAFPLVTMGPGLVNMLWGVMLFKEISGRRNFALLFLAAALYGAGVACIVGSKVG